MTPVNAFEILEIFQREHSDVVQAMQKTNHNYSSNDLNPFHLEGDVWTHTMMVFNYARINKFPIEVQLAALLHDIGKAYTLKTREKDGTIITSFYGHDGVSFYRCIDVLNDSYHFLTKDQIFTIAKLVALHSTLYNYKCVVSNEKIKHAFADDMRSLNLLSMLAEADSCGRISKEPSDYTEFRQYSELQTYSSSTTDKYSKEITILIGPPCSGKSTYIKEHNIGHNTVLISSDDIIEEIGIGSNYNEKWNNVDFKEVEEIMMKRFHKAVKLEQNIIIDRCNTSKKARRRFLSANKDYLTTGIVFFTGHNELKRRNEIRKEQGKFISSDVLHRIEMGLCYPVHDEFDNIIEI